MEQVNKKSNRLGKLFLESEVFRLAIILFIFLIVATITKSDKFFKISNFQNMMIQMSEYGLMALGCGIAMISGGIDLSTVYIANLSGIVSCIVINKTMQIGSGISIVIGIIAGLLTGAICGLFNGFLISKLNVPPMLATLGTFQLFLGIGVVLSNGTSVSLANKLFVGTTSKNIFGLFPVSFVIFILSTIILSIVLSRSVFGTHVYLVGTNQKASLYAGINKTKVIMLVYMLSGIVSSIAGLISLSRLSTAKADFGSSYTMLTILISVLGGVNPNGGYGKISGIGVGVITLQVISSYLNMFPSISNYYRDLIWGAALIIVLIINKELEKYKIKKQLQKQIS